MTDQTKTCPSWGDDYPADLPRRFWLGLETCGPCQDRRIENYANYKRRCIEHNERRRRELKARAAMERSRARTLDGDDYAAQKSSDWRIGGRRSEGRFD